MDSTKQVIPRWGLSAHYWLALVNAAQVRRAVRRARQQAGRGASAELEKAARCACMAARIDAPQIADDGDARCKPTLSLHQGAAPARALGVLPPTSKLKSSPCSQLPPAYNALLKCIQAGNLIRLCVITLTSEVY